jgi:ABC-type uncharacterized transport system YnjBCD permease subunit
VILLVAVMTTISHLVAFLRKSVIDWGRALHFEGVRRRVLRREVSLTARDVIFLEFTWVVAGYWKPADRLPLNEKCVSAESARSF